MIDRVMRRPELLATLGIGRERLDTLIKTGKFRKGFVIVPGGRATGWMASWAAEYLAQRIESADAPNVSVNLPALSKPVAVSEALPGIGHNGSPEPIEPRSPRRRSKRDTLSKRKPKRVRRLSKVEV
jgi:predicted DNA-binding transcriptional regulator AlpA